MYRSILINKLNELHKSLPDIATKIGVEQNMLSKFFGGKIELDFEIMLRLVHEIAPEKEFEIMILYIDDVESNDNLLCSLEYCSTNRLFDPWKQLFEKLDHTDNQELQGWLYLYRLAYQIHAKEHTDETILEKIDSFNAVTKEMRVFKNILVMILYFYNIKKQKAILDFAKESFEDLYFIPSGFLKAAYEVRIYHVLAHTHLMALGDINVSRSYDLKVIEQGSFKIYQIKSLVRIGISYFFEDYHESLDYLLQAERLSLELNVEQALVRGSLIFLKNLWDKQEEIPITKDKAEIAHYFIRKGKMEEGLKILDQLEDTGFRLYYRWLATNNPDHLYKALEMFNKSKSTYYSRGLIEPELIKLGGIPFN